MRNTDSTLDVRDRGTQNVDLFLAFTLRETARRCLERVTGRKFAEETADKIDDLRIIQLKPGARVTVRYRNWRGETATARIELQGAPFWGTTEWHPEPCWLVSGLDLETGSDRVWSVADMTPI